jgi:hypothetical protein
MWRSLLVGLLIFTMHDCKPQDIIQEKGTSSGWWFTTVNAPLVLRADPASSRYLVLENLTHNEIVGYTFGCVYMTDAGQRMEDSFVDRKHSIRPLGAIAELKLTYLDFYQNTCHNHLSKLSVVKVLFVDGTQWSLSLGSQADDLDPHQQK